MGHTAQDSIGGVLISLAVIHGHHNARPTVTLPAAGLMPCPLADTKLYCMVTEAYACEQLAQGCYLKA